MNVQRLDKNGFTGKQEWSSSQFIAPCVYYACPNLTANQGVEADQVNGSLSSAGKNKEQSAKVPQRRALLIFFCIPVSPGKSRLIWASPRNFGVWIDQIVPRWIFHLGQNLILDSDLYLLHLEEHRIMDIGTSNWQKACFVPTKSDSYVIAFRKWLKEHTGGQIDWRGKFSGVLPPSPPKVQLMDRYWSHVVNCRSCNSALKGLKALEVVLQVVSIASVGIVASAKHGMLSMAGRTALVSIALLCFAASKWLSHFTYKNFHFHDYNHALR